MAHCCPEGERLRVARYAVAAFTFAGCAMVSFADFTVGAFTVGFVVVVTAATTSCYAADAALRNHRATHGGDA